MFIFSAQRELEILKHLTAVHLRHILFFNAIYIVNMAGQRTF